MADIHSATAEIRRGNKKEEESRLQFPLKTFGVGVGDRLWYQKNRHQDENIP